MYLIALCDDEPAELEKTGLLLDDYERQHSGLWFETCWFGNTEELLRAVREDHYMPDLILMDIFMPDEEQGSQPMGMEAAKELRGMNYKGKIVFLTTSREYALEAFDVDAVQYIVKPGLEEKLFAVLDSLLENIEEERKKYTLLKIDGRHVKVPLNDIVYCEAQGKIQCVNMTNGIQYMQRMTMTELYEQLSRYQEFVKIGAAFIVNLGHIESMNTKEICMNNGVKIHLPRGTYKNLRERYFSYYCEESE